MIIFSNSSRLDAPRSQIPTPHEADDQGQGG
jgi:hypothetical protein